MKILVVEDDRETAESVRSGLAAGNNLVEVASDGVDGSYLGRCFDYDAIVLDYSLPKKDGITVCKEIRASGKKTPIIFVSNTYDTDTKITALKNGADDYITKPFSLQELEARLQALLRRPSIAEKKAYQVHDLSLDAEKQVVTRGAKVIHLTRKEYILLEYFMAHIGVILSRATLMEHVWTAESNLFSNTVEAHIRNLRKKLNSGNKANLIVNIPGRGYVIDTPENLKKL
jgi:DNA-binding response OmpR family regulator